MSTTEIIWTIAIAVFALILIGLIVNSMHKRNLASRHAQAEELRSEAIIDAAAMADARARAEQAEAEAQARAVEAERAERDAAIARTEVDQQQALQEDRIRAADRLDPEVDHKAGDYTPEVSVPAGPANVPGETTFTEPETGRAPDTATSPSPAGATGGSSVTLEPTDTTPRDTMVGTDDETLRNRLDGDAPGESGGSHRA